MKRAGCQESFKFSLIYISLHAENLKEYKTNRCRWLWPHFLYFTSFNYITNQPNHLINDSQIQKSNNREWISREDRSVLRVASSKVCYRHGLLDNFIDPSRHRTQYVYAISRGQHIRTMTGIEHWQTCVRWGNALGFQPFRMELDPNTGKFRRFNFSWKHPQSF